MGDRTCFEKFAARELFAHKKKVFTLGWNCDGKKLASGGHDGTIKIWSIEPSQAGRPERPGYEIATHKDQVTHLSWRPGDVNVLASLGGKVDDKVRVFDLRAKKETMVLPTSLNNMNVAWHPDGHMAVVSSRENSLWFLDLRKARLHKKVNVPFEVNEVAWGPDRDHFTVACGDGSLQVLPYPSLDQGAGLALAAHTGCCYCFGYSKDGRFLASGGGDAQVALFDMQDASCVRTFTRADQAVRTLSFSCDARWLAYAGEDYVVDVVSLELGDIVHTIPLRSYTDAVVWNPVSPVLAYAGDENRDGYGSVVIFAPPKGNS